ncbi:cysteine-rich receptor-like protein kinase 25 [Quercus suber]|uniref:Cysteine-rich receptor-like protein kinase 25 n=1 Tax=Quercus suber TaxID=58331 RepID=A0AAW0KTL0_QUESU
MALAQFHIVPPKVFQLHMLFVFLALLWDLAYADPPYHNCSNTGNYTVTSPFQNNLNNILHSLSSNASISKFYNTSTGNDTNRVYGLYMCLDYVTNESCHDCITTASQDIWKLCPSTTEAVVWEEICQLRYSNKSFFGILDVTGTTPLDNQKNNSQPEVFKSIVNVTLNNLANQAAFNLSANMYATGEAAFQDKTIYALVQCTRDLSANDCNLCLQSATADILRIYYYSVGARLLSRSCFLRYELYSFYGGTPNSSGSSQAGGIQMKLWMIVVVTVVSACLVIVLLGPYAWKLWNEGKALELMDPLLIDSFNKDEFLRYVQIGLLCVQEDASDRPTMSALVVMLKSETVSLSPPERPAFSMGRFTENNETDPDCLSVSGLSISSIRPRYPVCYHIWKMEKDKLHSQSPFENNLKQLLELLPSNTSVTGAKWKTWMVVVVTCVPLLVLAVLSGSCAVYHRRKKRTQPDDEKSQNALLHELARPTGIEITEDGELVPGSEDLHFMNLLTIRTATDDFSDSNKLGQGGFGTVYKKRN